MTRRPSIDEILRAVCLHTGVHVAQMTSESRSAANCAARMIAAYALRQLRGMSFPEVAQALGYKTHSSVVHLVKEQARREVIAQTSNRIYELVIAARK